MIHHATTVILLVATVTSQRPDVDFDDETCGRQMVPPVEGLIKNGFKSRPGEWPWHVAIFHRMENGAEFDYQCGGSLVHKYLVVTAAHCVRLSSSRKPKPSGDIIVKVGWFDISNRYQDQGREHEVDEIVMHRDYKPLKHANDIAILKLKVPAILTPYVQPVCLWKRDDGRSLPEFDGKLGTVVGWGLTENDTLASTLNKAQMPVVDTYKCLESDRPFFGKVLNKRIFCAGFMNGTGVCNGDSGGGMYFERESQWYLRGLVSFSTFVDSTKICNLKKYVGFTDAAQYLEWIYENAPVSRNDDPILGHPNVRLINQRDCGTNTGIIHYPIDQNNIIRKYLWMAILMHAFSFTDQAVECQGVLINKNYIISTDCVDWDDEVSVTLGDYNTYEARDCYETDQILWLTVLPERGPFKICLDPVQTTEIAEYFRKDDLVLARLSTPAFIGRRETIQAICLPVSPEQRNHVYPNYILTGWKLDGNDSIVLQRTVVDLIDQKTCREEMAKEEYASEKEKNITDAIVCTRNPKENIDWPQCKKYQPGAVIQAIDEQSNRYVLYGISTASSDCSLPDRFIAVTKYMEWILDHIRP